MTIETAGTIDLDVELKFTSTNTVQHRRAQEISRVAQGHLQGADDDLAAAGAQRAGARQRRAPLDAISSMYKINTASSEEAIVKQYNALLDNFNNAVLDRFGGRDYSAVFEKYIQA